MKTEVILFGGGIVTEGPLLSRPVGSCVMAENYEIPPGGGYREMRGYSLYDGSDSASAVTGSGDIRGVFIYKNDVYAIRDNLAGTAASLWKSTSTGWSLVDNTFPAGGKYEFLQYNFYAGTSTDYIYGANGVGRAFQFDGTTVTFINSTMIVDTPNHIAAFKRFLFLSFPGGSIQHSVAGNPLSWSPVLGAAELGMGQDVTSISVEQGDNLIIGTNRGIKILTGTGAIDVGTGLLDWNLKEYSEVTSVVEWSTQKLIQTMFLSDQGLVQISAADISGDFNLGTISKDFYTLLMALKKKEVAASVLVKSRNQYRLFLKDGTGLCCSFSGEAFLGATTFRYVDVMNVVYSGQVNGDEVLVAGSSDGKVFVLDSGLTFGGISKRHLLRTAFYHYRTPTTRKRFRRIHLEYESDGQSKLHIQPDFDYSSTKIAMAISEQYTFSASGGYWDADMWDEFIWALPLASLEPIRIQGLGVNMSVLFANSSATEEPITLYGMIVDYDERGRAR